MQHVLFMIRIMWSWANSTFGKSSSGQSREFAGAAVVKVLGSGLQECLDNLLIEDAELCCPITLLLLREPVVASDGFVYERAAVCKLIETGQPSPMTSSKLADQLFPSEQKKAEAAGFREARIRELLDFVEQAQMMEPGMCAVAMQRIQDYLKVLGAENFAELAARAKGLSVKLA